MKVLITAIAISIMATAVHAETLIPESCLNVDRVVEGWAPKTNPGYDFTS